MTRYLFFLIIPFLLIIPAYAEVGKNFDTQILPSGLTQWTSHYDRIWDGDSWENYLLTNNATQIKFESAGISFLFDKTTCDFKLYNPVTQTLAIDTYQFDLMVDAISRPASSCDVINLTQSEDDVSFIIDRTEFQTLFDLNPAGDMEWTHKIDNNEGKASTFTITETCKDCNPISIDGNIIDFGTYKLDTKNEIHNTVKETRADKGNYIIEFEKTISDKEKLIIDPIFGYSGGTERAIVSTSTIAATCSTTQSSNSAVVEIFKPTAAANSACRYQFVYFDITSIPTNIIVSDTVLRIDVDVISDPENCDIRHMSTNPSTATAQQILDDILDGTVYVDNNSWCTTVGNQKIIDLGTSADAGVQSDLSDNEFAIGIFFDTLTRDGLLHESDISDAEIQITYSSPYAVTTLAASDIRPTSVDLAWSTPVLNGHTVSGYQINSTTPWSSNVATVSENDTGSTTTSATVSGLSGNTQYSFRVGVRTTIGALNASGNVLNVTTEFDPTGSFTPGTFDLSATGNDTRAIIFERNNINANDMWLNITVDTDWNLACDIHYKFANTNQTYTTITNTTIDSETDAAAFRFNNVENEVIDVLCWDQYDLDNEGRFVITQTMFPLLEQVANFTSGVYGTQGNFGSLDFITIIVVIISMIGFNRNNELVGIILSLFLIGGLAVLSAGTIISWGPTLTAVFALIIMWGIGTARKD